MAEPFQVHLEAFHSPGELFAKLILIVAPALWVAALLYARLRSARVRKLEPVALAALALAPAAVWAPVGLLAALLLAPTLLAAGSAALRWMGPTDTQPVERLLLACGAGLGLTILLLFVLGLAGALSGPVVGATAIAALALGGREGGQTITAAWRSLRAAWETDDSAAGVAAFFAAVFLAPATMVALAPALAHDALAMHLPAARHYANITALQPLPFLDYSYFPQGFELLLAAQWPLGGQAGAQLVSPLLFALTLAALALIGRELGLSRKAVLVGCCAVFALPFLLWTGSVVKNDLALALLQTLGLYCWLRSRGRPDEAQWLRLGVLLIASGFAVKYTAMFTAAPLGVLYLWRLPRLARPVRETLLWTAIFTALALYWPARSWALTGNPVFPIELSWAVESLRPNEARPEETRSIPYWKIPWTIHFDGANAFEAPTQNPMGFFLLLFLPGWLAVRIRSGCAVLAFLGLFFLYWGSVWPVVRYAILPLGLLVLLTAHGLMRWRSAVQPWARWTLDGALALNFVFCLLPTLLMSGNGPQLALFAGRIDQAEYLRRTLITYPALEYLREHSAPGDWTLSIGANSGAYAPDPARIRYEYLTDVDHAFFVLASHLSQARYQWLITPADRAEETRNLMPQGWSAREEFRDSTLAVFRLESPADLPDPDGLTPRSSGRYDR